MAQAKYLTITATGTYVFPVDWQQNPFDLSYAVELITGSTTSFTVNFTLDDPDGTPAPAWIADPANGTAKTATVFGAYTGASLTAPRIRALQLVVATLTSSTLRFSMLQGSSVR